jgi:hypothetical protein
MENFHSGRAAMDQVDRVRAHSSQAANERIDREIAARVQAYAPQSRAAITYHIEELEQEWDIERALETTASALGLTSLVLGMTVNKRVLVFTGVVLAFLLQHALQGWCPPLVLFRQLGVRTRREIDAEKMAFKALRGDFDSVRSATNATEQARAALQVAYP